MTAPQSPPPDGELKELVHAVLDDRASAEQWARLSALLRDNPAACDYFTTHISMHARLRRVFANSVPPRVADRSGIDPALQNTAENQPPQPSGAAVRSRRLVHLGAALALALLIGFVAWIAPTGNAPPPDRSSETQPEHVAEIAYFQDDGSVIPRSRASNRVRAGQRIVVAERLAEIRLGNGVAVRLSGPSEITVNSIWLCTLHVGKAFVTVPPGADGFKLRAANTHITDYGTEFGVAVDEQGNAQVAVVKGRVGVRRDPIRGETNLISGQGVTVLPDGTLTRLYFIDESSFPTSLHWIAREPIILDVRDNVRGIDSLKYYRVASGAFGEDTPIYVDRAHQFNGMTETGLPPFLLGADYLMTFNDDKQTRNLELTLTLGRPADLYVLFDTRADIPAWLEQEFENTGAFVGVDETTVSRGPERLGSGPGVSIDNKLSVWKKTVNKPGEVQLGGVGAETSYYSMYSVVVMPH